MNVDFPAPFGPATSTRTGARSAAAARSDANRARGTVANEPAALEAAARAPAVRRDLDDDVRIVRIARIDRPAGGADPRLHDVAIGILGHSRERVVDVLGTYIRRQRQSLPGALE